VSIAKRKQTEEEVESDSKVIGVPASVFEQLVDNFPDMIHSVDENGAIISINQRGIDLLGYSREELIGFSVSKIYHSSVQEKLSVGFDYLIKNGKIGVRSTLVNNKGEKIDVEVRSISVYDENNNFVKSFTIIRDLQNIEGIKSQIAQTNKMAAVGELAGGILHDLKNPMTIISSYNEVAIKQFENKNYDKLPKYFRAIERACDKANKLLNHIAQFLRNDSAQFIPVNLAEVLDDSFFMTAKIITGHKVELVKINCDEIITIEGVHSQLEQVFINIIKNACEAMDGFEERKMTVSVVNNVDDVTITVADTGSGIPQGLIKNVFDSFFTTKDRGKGTGLGLSITNQVVTEHQGSVEIESEENKGTTFTICLPHKQVSAPEMENNVTNISKK